MKYGVSRKTLLLTAGTVWLVAGVNILRIGVMTWVGNPGNLLLQGVEATAVFLLFFLCIFKRLHTKYTRRIEGRSVQNHPFAFFDTRGWILMSFMIGLGIAVRELQLLPKSFIAVFYTGLSSALILTGLLFLRDGWKRPSES